MSQSPFTPEELDDLVGVFEQACREADAEDCPKTRDWIASQIFKAALEGERDLEKLRSRAMPSAEKRYEAGDRRIKSRPA